MTLTATRQGMAAAIVPLVADDVTVSADIPDSVAPPCIYVAWGIPWVIPRTHCLGHRRLVCLWVLAQPGLNADGF